MKLINHHMAYYKFLFPCHFLWFEIHSYSQSHQVIEKLVLLIRNDISFEFTYLLHAQRFARLKLRKGNWLKDKVWHKQLFVLRYRIFWKEIDRIRITLFALLVINVWDGKYFFFWATKIPLKSNYWIKASLWFRNWRILWVRMERKKNSCNKGSNIYRSIR